MDIGTLSFAIVTSLFLFVGIYLPIWVLGSHPMPEEPPIHRKIAQAVGVDQKTIFESPMIGHALSLAMVIARRVTLPSLRGRIRRDLNAIGNPMGYTVEQYLALSIASGITFAIVATSIDFALTGGTGLLFTVPFFSAFGFYLPIATLSSGARRRLTRISKQLPYTLDLISLVVEAGASFGEAVQTLIRDNPEDDFNQELKIALSEIEFGSTRSLALSNLAERIPLESLRSVVGAINQADKLGTPLADILKLQSDMIRNQRTVRAEKLAASASLRILIPTMVIMLAVIALVIIPFGIALFNSGSLSL